MSRIGKLPITVPAGVTVDINGGHVKVKGPKGELERTFSPQIAIEQDGPEIKITRPSDEPAMRALHGTTRALINNMVHGVSQGWSKVLEIHGVGYRAELKGSTLVMSLGFSHPVEIVPPEGVSFAADPKARTVTVTGPNKEVVGQVASEIRGWRPPEPYKGKGVRYLGEYVRRKAGKAGKAG